MDRKSSQGSVQQEAHREEVDVPHDTEAGMKESQEASHHAGPFGDEEFAEVKYRTMTWW
jgi:type VI protein secretion system component Hcp